MSSRIGFHVGAARVDVTPPLTIPYLGYASSGRHQFYRGVHDPLHARAVVVDDGETKVALLSVDSIGFKRRSLFADGRDFIGEVRQRVERLCSIPAGNVMLHATHAHSTPETIGFRPLTQHPGAAEWLEVLTDQLASAVAIADQRRKPVQLKIGKGSVEGISYSRRILRRDGTLCQWRNRPPNDEVEDWGANDFEAVVLGFEDADGAPVVSLVHFACHPTIVQVNPLVSADYPGAATAFIENAAIGCECCLFLQGACGSINPRRGTTGFDDVRRTGQALAGETLKLLSVMSAPDYPVAPPQVAAISQTIEIPSRPLPPLAQLEQEKERLEVESNGADSAETRERLAGEIGLLDERMARVREGDDPVDAEVQVFRIGDAALVGVPAEPFCQMGLAIKQFPEASISLCLGYANDYLGYVAPQSEWDRGGYEVSVGMWSILAPEACDQLLEAAKQEVKTLFSGL
ncbi:MAG: hypothetical protein COS85_04315 [Armatimonadetes bacterium CG07_land_8_20_14_0_80_59_28]|nr:MAG: hypothetical protein COS85_04315 [Armatimonadetes bacterium CG07_land_8_20_14_0_80_59_28]PIX41562.1 MAG: hypothetical protein COZ56_11675 [Armatimonadetes bacterium CG_4_8_14_3_um_filter_58_9]